MQFFGHGDEAAELAEFEHRFKTYIDQVIRYLEDELFRVQESARLIGQQHGQ
ncbi:hypothetical protein ACFSUI_23780 [Ralstonia solanacearum]